MKDMYFKMGYSLSGMALGKIQQKQHKQQFSKNDFHS